MFYVIVIKSTVTECEECVYCVLQKKLEKVYFV